MTTVVAEGKGEAGVLEAKGEGLFVEAVAVRSRLLTTLQFIGTVRTFGSSVAMGSTDFLIVFARFSAFGASNT